MHAVETIRQALVNQGMTKGMRINGSDWGKPFVRLCCDDIIAACDAVPAVKRMDEIVVALRAGSAACKPGSSVEIYADDAFHLIELAEVK